MYVFIISLCLSVKLLYTVEDNDIPILIQNTNGNLHWHSLNPLALFSNNCLFPLNNNLKIFLNGEAPSQGP